MVGGISKSYSSKDLSKLKKANRNTKGLKRKKAIKEKTLYKEQNG
tara:strand:+ start:465 stop:599 length:135 start_codon:yes stop_codon:yes gene_type:complete